MAYSAVTWTPVSFCVWTKQVPEANQVLIMELVRFDSNLQEPDCPHLRNEARTRPYVSLKYSC